MGEAVLSGARRQTLWTLAVGTALVVQMALHDKPLRWRPPPPEPVVRLHLAPLDAAPAPEAAPPPRALPRRTLRLSLPLRPPSFSPFGAPPSLDAFPPRSPESSLSIVVSDASPDSTFLRLRLAVRTAWGGVEPFVGAELITRGEPLTALDDLAARAAPMSLGAAAGLRLTF